MLRILVAGCLMLVLAAGALRADGEDEPADGGSPQEGRVEIDHVLDTFHDAAAKADGERYFAQMTKDAVFLGTDASERWSKQAFEVFARPYFDRGKGWSYTSREREVTLESGGELAWFDELLENKSYGTCRGTGVLRRIGSVWRIAQYSLSIPIPNPLARQVVAEIRAHEREASSRAVIYLVRHAEKCGGEDPGLTTDGHARARQLSRVLRSAGIDRIYATQWKRTQQTVAPTAKALGLSVTKIDDTAVKELVRRVKQDTKSDAILIAGHSYTLAKILQGLGVTASVSVGGLFDNLYVVRLRAGAPPGFQHLHYGK